MKVAIASVCALLGICALCAAVYWIRPAGGASAPSSAPSAPPGPADSSAEPVASAPPSSSAPTPTRTPIDFSLGATLRIEGRVGHPALLSGAPQETYLLLELTADESDLGRSPTVDLALVIDGADWLKASAQGAIEAVRALRDGDSVSIVAFGEKAEVIRKPITLSAKTRPLVEDALRTIKPVRGDACLSCGIEQGLIQLREAIAARATTDVQRMVVLSSRAPALGATDVADLTALADRARGVRVPITTVGLGTGYDERALRALAIGSNGRHAFVEREPDLAPVLRTESKEIDDIVITRAIALFDLPAGVELVSVLDRPHRKAGGRVSMALGDFASGEKKTVLVKILVPAAPRGQLEVAQVRVRYGDVSRQLDVGEFATLAVDLVPDPSQVSLLGGILLERLQRSETAAAIADAGALLRTAKPEDATHRLADAKRALEDSRAKAGITAWPPRAHVLETSFDEQALALDRAAKSLAAAGRAASAADVERERRKVICDATSSAVRFVQ